MKKIISLFLTVTMIASLIVAIPVGNVAAAETITDEALFMTYPTYLSNSEMDEGLQKAEAAYRAVLNSYSKTDETVAAFMTSMSEGISIVVRDTMGKLGLGETYYEENAKKAATKYMLSMLSNESAIKKATNEINTAYKTLKTSYNVASSVDKAKLLSDLRKLAQENNVHISVEGMDKVVNKLYDAGSLKKELDAIGEANELWKYVLEFTEIHAIEMATLDMLIDELKFAGQTKGDLYLGLTLLKEEIELDQAEYVLKRYSNSKVVSFIAKNIDKFFYSFAEGSTVTVAFVTTFCKLFADYIYVNAKADAIAQATMQSSFVSSIDICLSQYRLKFLQGKGTNEDIKKYEILYGAYLSAVKSTLDTCYDVAKIGDKFSLGGDCMVWSSNIESIYTYDNYINWCKEEVAHDIEVKELDKETGDSTITDALNEETIKARLDKIISRYPNGSSWAGDFMGVSESLGYVCKNFNHIFDTSMVGMVQDDYKYILKSNVNVRLVGMLEEEGVTETSLKELFSKARVGDVIITSGQYDYLHAMILVELGENGAVVYDVGSKFGPEQDPYKYTWLIQKYEFPYSKMADAFSKNGEYMTKPGISIYRAIKKVNTTNSGTSLYYEEYDDSVNYVIEDGVLTGYKGSRTTIEVPDGVTAINNSCFANNANIKYVYMPDTITWIGISAFRSCDNLRSVKFSNNLKSIGNYAFENCDSMTAITIPGNPEIGVRAFGNCKKLANIILSEDIIKLDYEVFGDTAWYENQPEGAIYLSNVFYKYKYIENWYCVGGSDDKSHWSHCTLTGYSPLPEDIDLVIKDGTRGIAVGALSDYHDSIYLPESLECASFGGFSNLETIYYNPIRLDCSPTVWANVGFYENCSAKTLYIGENVEYIDYGVFNGLMSLENVYYNAKKCTDMYTSFQNATNLNNICIGENVEIIPSCSFEGASIEKIVLSNSIIEIGYNAFANCKKLKEVIISKQITEELYFNNIFTSCNDLKSVTVEDDNERYYDIDGVVYDKIKNKLVFIPQAIETLTIPKDVGIDYGIFSSGYSGSSGGFGSIFDEVEIKIEPSWEKYDKLYSINAEEGNKKLVSKDGVLYTSGLSQLLLYPAMKETKEYITPDNLYSMGSGAFAGNDYLEKVYIKSDNYYSLRTDYDIDCSGLFAECSNLKYVDFEVSQKSLSSFMFYNCQNLEDINFPDGLEEIYNCAFANCTKLETIEIPEGVKKIDDSAFYNCKSLKSIYLPKTIERLGNYPFSGCKSLTDIYYEGTEEQWNNLYVQTDLESVNVHYNYVAPTPQITEFTIDNAGNFNLSVVDASDDAIVYVASYNGDKLLEIQKLTLNNGQASGIFQTTGVTSYKAFVWKDLRPLCEAEIINQ